MALSVTASGAAPFGDCKSPGGLCLCELLGLSFGDAAKSEGGQDGYRGWGDTGQIDSDKKGEEKQAEHNY